MRLGEIIALLDGQLLTDNVQLDLEIAGACGADLMSDVLATIKSGSILLTGLVSLQTVRTAQMADVAAVVFVRGKRPTDDIVSLARSEGVPIVWTRCSLYQSCGRLYQAGLSGSYEEFCD